MSPKLIMVTKHSQIVETAFLGGKMYNNNEFYYMSGVVKVGFEGGC